MALLISLTNMSNALSSVADAGQSCQAALDDAEPQPDTPEAYQLILYLKGDCLLIGYFVTVTDTHNNTLAMTLVRPFEQR